MSQLKIMNNEKEEKSFNTKEAFSSRRLSSWVYVCVHITCGSGAGMSWLHLPLSLGRGSLTEPSVHWLAGLTVEWAPEILLSLTSCAKITRVHKHAWIFYK